MSTIITIYLRCGRKLEVSDINYVKLERLILENKDKGILLTDAHDEAFKYVVNKDAIDYIERTIN